MRTEDNARVPSPLTQAAAQYSISWQVARSRATDFGLLLLPSLLSSISSAGAKGGKEKRGIGDPTLRAHTQSPSFSFHTGPQGVTVGEGGKLSPGKLVFLNPFPIVGECLGRRKRLCYNHERVCVSDQPFFSLIAASSSPSSP